MGLNLEIDQNTIYLLSRARLLKPYIRQLALARSIEAVNLSDEEIATAVQEFMKSQELATAADFELFLRINHLREEDLLELATEPIKVKQLIASNYLPKAETRYLQRKAELDVVVYSLIRVSSEELARELFLQITEDGIELGLLSSQYSEGPEKATRGVVGPVPMSRAHPKLTERLKTRAIGELIEPFAIEHWWIIARVEHRVSTEFNNEIAWKLATELFEEDISNQTSDELKILSKMHGETL